MLAFFGLINYGCQTSSRSISSNSKNGERVIPDSRAKNGVTSSATVLKDTTNTTDKTKVSDYKGTCSGTCMGCDGCTG